MCDRPLRGFQIGYTRKGKPDYLICSPEVDYIYKDGNDKWIKMHGSVPKTLNADYITKFQPIPCGSCLSCRIARAAEMADRCMLEAQYHDENCFVTLTYSDDNIIRCNYTNVATGECGVSETLFKRDYQTFIKRLRKHIGNNDLRYVLCGEYGETTFRPHYHCILFGYRPADLVPFSVNHRGQALYLSSELEKLWKKGHVIVGDVSKDSCNYVSRYVTKKLYGDFGTEEYQDKGRIPPFIVSSKRPAIGKRWYEDNKDWCFETQISYSTPSGGHSFKAPRYFRKLREKELTVEQDMKYTILDDLRSELTYQGQLHRKDHTDLGQKEEADAKERSSKAKAKNFKRDSV